MQPRNINTVHRIEETEINTGIFGTIFIGIIEYFLKQP